MSDSGPYKQTGPVGVMGRTRQIQACASLSHVDMYFVYVGVSNCKYYCFVTNVDDYTFIVNIFFTVDDESSDDEEKNKPDTSTHTFTHGKKKYIRKHLKQNVSVLHVIYQ